MDRDAWASMLDSTVDAAADVVAAAGDADWSVRTAGLRWSARETLRHLASCHVGYAGQLTAPRPRGWVPFEVVLEDPAASAGLAEVVRATGGILSAVVRTTAPGVTSHHPYGTAGPCDFAAMGIVETVVHVDDLACTFALTWVPRDDACRAVLAQLFPDVVLESDPWTTLRWATGRLALPDAPRRRRWRWTNTAS